MTTSDAPRGNDKGASYVVTSSDVNSASIRGRHYLNRCCGLEPLVGYHIPTENRYLAGCTASFVNTRFDHSNWICCENREDDRVALGLEGDRHFLESVG